MAVPLPWRGKRKKEAQEIKGKAAIFNQAWWMPQVGVAMVGLKTGMFHWLGLMHLLVLHILYQP